ncbi:hypothetical protein CLV43_120154 [Umezawaea tangerina]|uniref:DUF2267 domain-containing protein n=2 Tax=Umezawaea tangerina TaxID=84725 RepID=A0A2T0SH52_9PSEU|nr:hypothetical protein CLV43_120154 [Umezawaea tangerina]
MVRTERKRRMPDEGLRLLAGTVAGALVKAMDTHLWNGVRSEVAGVLGSGVPRRVEVVSTRLQASRDELALVPWERQTQARADFATEWRGSIHAVLWEHPELEGELRAVLGAISPVLPHTPVDAAVVHPGPATG